MKVFGCFDEVEDQLTCGCLLCAYNLSHITFINTTPHDIQLGDGFDKIVFSRSPAPLRLVEYETRPSEDLQFTKINYKSFSADNTGLPVEKIGTYYIVSLPVAQAFPERADFVIPDDIIRDENGVIIGCNSFKHI